MTIKDISFIPSIKCIEGEQVIFVCNIANESYSNAFFEKVTSSREAQKIKNGKWEFLTDEEMRFEIDNNYEDLQRKCMLALNGFVVRRENLKKWQDDLSSVLEGNKPEDEIIKACNYNTAQVSQPKNKWYMLKDASFLLHWCVGIQNQLRKPKTGNTIGIAAWKEETKKIDCDILPNGHIRFPGTPRQFLKKAKDNHISIPDLKILSENVETLRGKEYSLKSQDSWNKAKTTPRKRAR